MEIEQITSGEKRGSTPTSFRIDHFCIGVSDLNAQTDFYMQGFGLEVHQRLNFTQYNFSSVLLRHQDGWGVELRRNDVGPPRPIPRFEGDQQDVRHICFWVDDVTLANDHLVSLGATVQFPPEASVVPGVFYSYLIDPEGNFLELMGPR